MRVSVNLATRPFVELRPLFAKLRLATIGLVVLAIIFMFMLRSLRAKADVAETEMNALKGKTQQYQQERQRNESRMRQPQNMAVLERSQFLNALFARKGFSWTSVMMDLERVLPGGVQVTSIDPTTSKTGEVSIRLRISGERERAVELVRNLEHSQRFISPRLSGEQMQAQDTGRVALHPTTMPGAVEFDILSGYNPLQQDAKSGKADKSESGKSSSKKAGTPKAPKTGATGAVDANGASKPQTISRRARGVKAAPPNQRHLATPQGGVR
ncbi:MAG: fimbrial assembly protein [Edaphobacter sp.]|uniref:PilN domain-containing protein n=1 Tax=Edaphobacter sp. TaxID=1934404 RepID=UPI002384CF31|nr:PilN domain-containing protein [Edaphobacter sp.]MDE1177494.1 fimbrial assembly protein [Edaphobacter sp.]